MGGAQTIEAEVRAADYLPRLLYAGDVPIETFMHGSTLLSRLLSAYPRDKLLVIEGFQTSAFDRRISGVEYRMLKPSWVRLLHTRFHSYVSLAATLAAPTYAAPLADLASDFRPEAVLTIVTGYSWIAADRYARRARLPLHLIVHDEWAHAVYRTRAESRLIEHRLGPVYRTAASRLCISPYMADEYFRRYGASAETLYPSRGTDYPVFTTPAESLRGPCRPFTVAFGGTIYREYARALQRLAIALRPGGGRVLVFGMKPYEGLDRFLGEPNIELRGRVSPRELIRVCREEAHAMFIPMSHRAEDRRNMEVSFPSKLADCTAAGLPLLIDGPDYCSAVRWARENPGVAEVVTLESVDALAEALGRLQESDTRLRLAEQAIRRGQEYFAHERAVSTFMTAVSGPHE